MIFLRVRAFGLCALTDQSVDGDKRRMLRYVRRDLLMRTNENDLSEENLFRTANANM